MKTKKAKRIKVSRQTFRMELVPDEMTDLSFLGEYGNEWRDGCIDRKERGDIGWGEYRYFYPAMTGEETGNPESPEQDYERMEAYNRGDWAMVGVRAVVDIELAGCMHTVRSPGLWGIESDSADYHKEVFAEECEQLADMLEDMGNVEVIS